MLCVARNSLVAFVVRSVGVVDPAGVVHLDGGALLRDGSAVAFLGNRLLDTHVCGERCFACGDGAGDGDRKQ